MLRIMTIGDPHFGALERFLGFQAGLALQIKVISNALKEARQNGILHVVFLGDQFNSPYPDQRLLGRFIKLLASFPDLSIYVLRGNHEYVSEEINGLNLLGAITSSLLPHVHYEKKSYLRIVENIPLLFLHWPETDTQLLKGRPGIVYFHSEVDGAKSESKRMFTKTGKDLQKMDPAGKCWFISGHLHTYQTVGDHCLYPGTHYQLKFGEVPERGYVVSEIKRQGDRLKVEHQRYLRKSGIRLIQCEINKPSDLKKCVQEKEGIQYFYSAVIRCELPANWRLLYPQIHTISGEAITREEIMNQDSPAFNLVGSIKGTLKNSYPPLIANRAIQILRDLTSEV